MPRTDHTARELLEPATSLPPGDDKIWRGHHFTWKRFDSWGPQLTAWLQPHFRKDGLRRLKPGVFRDLCWDDPDWSDLLERCLLAHLDYFAEQLADALEHSVLRTFHGCRTDDARSYFELGIRIHNRGAMTAQLRSLVETHEELFWLRTRLDDAIARIDNTIDNGRLYVVADDTSLLDHAAHYLIYGSEWIAAVLGGGYRHVLLKTGTPTLLEIDLPLRVSSTGIRKELANKMLAEWTRHACNRPDWHAPIDFTFGLHADIPPAWIVGHTHPAELRDPLEQRQLDRSPRTTCAYCTAEIVNKTKGTPTGDFA